MQVPQFFCIDDTHNLNPKILINARMFLCFQHHQITTIFSTNFSIIKKPYHSVVVVSVKELGRKGTRILDCVRKKLWCFLGS